MNYRWLGFCVLNFVSLQIVQLHKIIIINRTLDNALNYKLDQVFIKSMYNKYV